MIIIFLLIFKRFSYYFKWKENFFKSVKERKTLESRLMDFYFIFFCFLSDAKLEIGIQDFMTFVIAFFIYYLIKILLIQISVS